jgi:hypothetical protein
LRKENIKKYGRESKEVPKGTEEDIKRRRSRKRR